MKTQSKIWQTTVNELIFVCAESIRAMVPFAERVKMPWKEPSSYDDWTAICGVLFDSLVSRSIKYSSEWHEFKPLLKYDQRIISYNENSFISERNKPFNTALICFETISDPFDCGLFAVLDDVGLVVGDKRILLETAEFSLVGRKSSGLTCIESLSVSV
jgi:hypothetical protein